MYADDVFGSCDELLSYGITEPGWYYIKHPNATQSTKVKCFQPGKIMLKNRLPDIFYAVNVFT